jgi:purine-binding chemotaxis protein CheW
VSARFDFERARERLARARVEGPGPEEQRALLEQRARELATVVQEPQDEGDELFVVRFTLGGEPFAAPAEHVIEAVELGQPTPVPGTPEVLIGVLNHRGRVLPVLDLRRVLGTGAGGELTHVVVVSADGATFGIAVETVEETVRERASDPLRTLLDVESLAGDPRLRIDD